MDKQTKVLKDIAEIFNEEFIPAVYRKKNADISLPMDMVSLLYPSYGNGDGEVSVDLFFLPVAAANDETQYFSVVLNIAEEISSDYRADMLEAVNMLNLLSPFGTYALSAEGSTVFYKLVTPLSANLEIKQLEEQVNLSVANVLDSAEMFVGLLQKMAKGQASLKDIESMH